MRVRFRWLRTRRHPARELWMAPREGGYRPTPNPHASKTHGPPPKGPGAVTQPRGVSE